MDLSYNKWLPLKGGTIHGMIDQQGGIEIIERYSSVKERGEITEIFLPSGGDETFQLPGISDFYCHVCVMSWVGLVPRTTICKVGTRTTNNL